MPYDVNTKGTTLNGVLQALIDTVTALQGELNVNLLSADGVTAQVGATEILDGKLVTLGLLGDEEFTDPGVTVVSAQSYLRALALAAIQQTFGEGGALRVVVSDPAGEELTYYGYQLSDYSVASATGSSETLVAANPERSALKIINNSPDSWWLQLTGEDGDAEVAGASSFELPPGGLYEPQVPPLNEIKGIGTAGATLCVKEG